MNLLCELIGTFLMFLGFFGMLAGVLIYRTDQESLGKFYLSATMMAGGESSDAPLVRFLVRIRGNDALKERYARRLLLGGLAVALAGAWLT